MLKPMHLPREQLQAIHIRHCIAAQLVVDAADALREMYRQGLTQEQIAEKVMGANDSLDIWTRAVAEALKVVMRENERMKIATRNRAMVPDDVRQAINQRITLLGVEARGQVPWTPEEEDRLRDLCRIPECQYQTGGNKGKPILHLVSAILNEEFHAAELDEGLPVRGHQACALKLWELRKKR